MNNKMQLPSTLLKAAYTLPLLGLMLLTSCSRHSENTGGKALSIDSMPVQKFVIAADKDTTLACNERIIIRIRKRN